MLDPRVFTERLTAIGFTLFAGVPDSLLKEVCSCIDDTVPSEQHIIAANEGGAIGLAAGHYLGTGEAAVVYMQNSGLGNAVNPLLSLADPAVYSIPMLLIVGWRGEPGVQDEPQHKKQGAVQVPLLSALGYPFDVLADEGATAARQLEGLSAIMRQDSTPVVLVVRRNTFSAYTRESLEPVSPYKMTREQALVSILDSIGPDDRIVSTTGKTSRELYELREARGEGHERDFLTVGCMGHASMIATGLARSLSHPVVCVDGDGAVLMHTGALGIAAVHAPENFLHVVINNGAHDSVGGQPTIGHSLRMDILARQFGYREAAVAESAESINAAIRNLRNKGGPALLEIRVAKGARKDLGRPTTSPRRNKESFRNAI